MFPVRNLLLNNVHSMQALLTKVNINENLQYMQGCDFYNIFKHFYIFYMLIFVCPSEETLNGAQCQRYQPPWHAKDRFTGFR